jgi:hypothetical protein
MGQFARVWRGAEKRAQVVDVTKVLRDLAAPVRKRVTGEDIDVVLPKS